jgi:hypothetical protein
MIRHGLTQPNVLAPVFTVLAVTHHRGPLLVEVWEDRASAAAAAPLQGSEVFCPIVSSQVGTVDIKQ